MSPEQVYFLVIMRGLQSGWWTSLLFGPFFFALVYMGWLAPPSWVLADAVILWLCYRIVCNLESSYAFLGKESYIGWYFATAIIAWIFGAVSVLLLGAPKSVFAAAVLYGLYCFLHSQPERKTQNWSDWGKWFSSEATYRNMRWGVGAAAFVAWMHYIVLDVLFWGFSGVG